MARSVYGVSLMRSPGPAAAVGAVLLAVVITLLGPVLLVLTAVALLGGDTLTDFALALLIGLAVGTYSSMFTATPLAVELHRRTSARPRS